MSLRIRYDGPSIGQKRCNDHELEVILTYMSMQVDVLDYTSMYIDDCIAKRRKAISIRDIFAEACEYVNAHDKWADNILNMYVYVVGEGRDCDIRFAYTDCEMEDSGCLEMSEV